MSQFEDWPLDDLRLYRQNYSDGTSEMLVFSVDMDALTPVDASEAERLRARGVAEIEELPD